MEGDAGGVGNSDLVQGYTEAPCPGQLQGKRHGGLGVAFPAAGGEDLRPAGDGVGGKLPEGDHAHDVLTVHNGELLKIAALHLFFAPVADQYLNIGKGHIRVLAFLKCGGVSGLKIPQCDHKNVPAFSLGLAVAR